MDAKRACRLSAGQIVALSVFAAVVTPYAGAKHGGTNDVDGAGGAITNGPPAGLMMSAGPRGSSSPRIVPVSAEPRSLTENDFSAGLVLSRVGTGEVFSFGAPDDAAVCAKWRDVGASTDHCPVDLRGWSCPFGTGTVSRLTAYSGGAVRPDRTDPTTLFAPLGTTLGIVPECRWAEAGEGITSRFWSALTADDTFVMTWQDVMVGRDPAYPVSFQIELFTNGDVTYRYDLSRLPDAALAARVALLNGGDGVDCDLIPTDVTSIEFRRVTQADRVDPDRDGDGVPTLDELFVHHTDPGCADTDRDGLSDGDEVDVFSSDPLDANSIRADVPDGTAAVIGDADPFAYPEGSTNTVLEHVFYTGTTNAPFAYPISTGSTAVLDVTVSGSGSGRLVIGDTVVPLVAKPQSGPLLGANGPSDSTATTLHVLVPRGTMQNCFLRVPDSLEVAISSADFVYGERPTFLHPRGWLAFPNTEASHPCIHDLNSRKVDVVLDPGFPAPGLTCVWNSSASVGAVPTGDHSATLFGRFSPSSTAPVTYTLSHPLYICGRTTYTQTARYCPRVDDDSVLPEGDGERSDEEYDRCLCGDLFDHSGCMIPGCDCYCHQVDLPPTDSDCDVHDCPFAECESLHRAAYEASNALPLQPDLLLLLREPPHADGIDLEAPPPGTPCCPCPDHNQNPLSLAMKSFNLAVRDAAGKKFVSTNADCTVFVHGLSPSRSVGDSVAIFCKTGVVSDVRRYTVLGMGIESDEGGVDVAELKRQNQDFGLPVVVKGENPATYLRLNAAVRLPEGDVHLAFTNATARFRLTINFGDDELTLIDTDEKPTLDLSLLKWRSIASLTDYGDGAVVKLYAYGKGHVDLDFGYAMANGQSGIRDFDRLRITAIEPMLVPDFDRDGSIDEDDFAMSRQGKTFRFWVNDDNDSGDTNESKDDRPGAGLNHADDEVNGRCDFLDFTPICIDIANAFPDDVSVSDKSRFRWRLTSNCLKSVWTGLSIAEAGLFQRDDCGAAFGAGLNVLLPRASTVDLSEGVELNDDFLLAVTNTAGGVMLVEGCSLGSDLILEGMILQGGVWSVVCEQHMKLSVSAVEDMYWFHSLYGAEQNRSFTPPVVQAPLNLWDAEECDKDIFFTHGFRVNEPDSHAWGAEAFKRFWQSGSNARFHMFTWAGAYGMPDSGLYYPQNAYQAQMSGGALKRLIEREQTDPAKRILMTQSLGNMVACEALREGLQVAQYYMFDAALASESIDETLRVESSEDAGFSKYVRPDWHDYTNACWASNWYRFFEDDPNDARGKMKWPGRFTDALTNATEVFNYYSSGDSVFHETEDPPWLLEGMLESNDNYCWQKQETLKGMKIVAGTAYGGWGFHRWRIAGFDYQYTSIEAANMVVDGSITNNPVFDRGYAPMLSGGASEQEVFTALAKYIPALSSPVGGNTIGKLVNNIDMNDSDDGVPRPNGWGRPAVKNQTPWLHSDMKDMAFFYVYKLYEQLIQKGNLK